MFLGMDTHKNQPALTSVIALSLCAGLFGGVRGSAVHSFYRPKDPPPPSLIQARSAAAALPLPPVPLLPPGPAEFSPRCAEDRSSGIRWDGTRYDLDEAFAA